MRIKCTFNECLKIEDRTTYAAVFSVIRPHLDFSDQQKIWEFLFNTASVDITDDITDEFEHLSKRQKSRLRDLMDGTFEDICERYKAEYRTTANGQCTPRHPPSVTALNKIQGRLQATMNEANGYFAEAVLAVQEKPIHREDLKPAI